MIEINLEKTCGICENEITCLDEPMDANECDSFRNLDISRMENALKIISDSNWLSKHDNDNREKVIKEYTDELYKHLTKEMPKELNSDARYGYACALSMILERCKRFT